MTATLTPRTSLPAPRRRAIAAQTAMEVRLMLRSGESLLVTLGIPLALLVFASVIDVLPTGDRDPVDFLVPGVLAISVLSSAFVAQSIQTAFERKYGVLKRLGGTPLTRTSFLTAKAIAVGIVLLLQTVLVLGIATFGLGWEPSGAILAAVAAMAVGTFTFTALGLLIAGTLRAEGTLAVTNALFLVLMVVSGAAFESGALPSALAAVGTALPSGALAAALRAAIEHGVWDGAALAIVAAWGALFAVVSARTFRWEP